MNRVSQICFAVVAVVLFALISWVMFSTNSGPEQSIPEGTASPTAKPSAVFRDAGVPNQIQNRASTPPTRIAQKSELSEFNGSARLYIHLQNRDSEPQANHSIIVHPRVDAISEAALHAYQLWSAQQENHRLFVSDANGDVSLKVPNGIPFRLESAVDDKSNMSGSVVVPALRPNQSYRITMLLRVMSDQKFFGRVVHASTNTAITHALIRGGGRITQTDEQGLFRFSSLPEQSVLKIEAAGYAEARVFSSSQCTSIDIAQRIDLNQESRVFGSVLFGAKAAVDAKVMFWPSIDPSSPEVFQPRISADVDETGSYSVGALQPNLTYYAKVQLPSTAYPMSCVESFQLQEGESQRFDIQLSEWPSIRGKVHCTDGTVGAGAVLQIQRAHPSDEFEIPGSIVDRHYFHRRGGNEYVADEFGEYYIPILPPGRWKVGVLSERNVRQPWASQATLVDLPAGVGEVRVDHLLQVGQFISGWVVDSRGIRVPGAEVYARDERGSIMRCANQEGEFRIGPLFGESYELNLVSLFRLNGESAPNPISVLAGDQDIELKSLVSAGYRLELIDSNAQPQWGRVTMIHESTQREFAVSTDQKGLALVGDMQPGRYKLLAQGFDGKIARVNGVELRAGQTKNLGRLVLEEMVHLTVQVSNSEERPQGEEIELWVEVEGVKSKFWTTQIGGSYGVRLPIGIYQFELRYQGEVVCAATHEVNPSKRSIILQPQFGS